MPGEQTVVTSPQPGAPMSVADIYANARALSGFLRDKSDEIEAARTLPPEVAARMREAGLFRVAMPKIWGGPEMSIVEINEVIEEVSRANASAGWCITIGCDSGCFSAYLDDAVARKLYPRRDMVTAGSITPGAVPIWVIGRSGYRHPVDNGPSPRGSNNHADVVLAACIVFANGSPVMQGNVPTMRIAMASASSFEVLDTWRTTGMRGTGSYDFRASNLFIPEEHSFRFGSPMKRSGTLYSYPLNFLTKFYGVPLGMARAMIDQVTELMQTKVELPSGRPYKNISRIQTALAEAEMILAAARAYSYSALERHWKRLEGGDEPSERDRIDLALARVNAAQAARNVIRMLYDTVGSNAIYAQRGPFDRALRDIETLCQHFAVQRRVLENCGVLLLKADAPPPPYL